MYPAPDPRGAVRLAGVNSSQGGGSKDTWIVDSEDEVRRRAEPESKPGPGKPKPRGAQNMLSAC